MALDRTNTYECMCVLDNREVRNGWQTLKDAVAGIFTKHGAQILSSRRWEERRLAYPIRRQQRGTYLLTYFKSDTQQLTGIRRDLQFQESVLRSLVLACEEVPQSAYEPEAAFDVNAIPSEDAPAASPPVAPAAAVVAVAVEEAKVESADAKVATKEES